jgi:hypothetical protein
VTLFRGPRLIPAVLFVLFSVAAIAPIRSYDLFWHLATGRWIVEHRALPLMDPFAVASDRVEWINGAWLAQVLAYLLHELVGTAGLSIVRGIGAGLLFTLIHVFATRHAKPHVAAALTALGFAGAMPLLDVRPSGLAALFVVLAIEYRSWLAQAIVAALWINVHASALLAPVIAVFSTRRAAPVIVAAIALLVNPYGWKAITAPIELMSYVGSGTFVNLEWRPSMPQTFPLLYLAVGVGILAFATAEDRRAQWWRAALFVMFAYLAIRHARHQPLFFASFPLVVAPAVRRAHEKLAFAVAAACLLFAFATNEHYLGLMRGRFPVDATAQLRASGLRGNIYNADQFGGYLIWSFQPERRVLNDGRNELYRTFIPEVQRAREDQRAWRALLRKYRIDLAVEEYLPPLIVTDGITGKKIEMPASLAYWPRREWALIGYDEAAMVFARRAAFPPEVIAKLEIRGRVPD